MVRQWSSRSTPRPIQPTAVQLILQDHQALATVIRTLQQSVDNARRAPGGPDFESLRAMLFYLDEMPARAHHANESGLLFPRIRERCPALRPVLDRLEAEHARGESSVRELEHALSAWQVMGDTRREGFEVLLRAYTESYLGHMEVEENYVLPVAMDYLSTADWRDLAAAFERDRTLAGDEAARGHSALFERIVSSHNDD